jgi:hypothetical protein
MTDPPPEIEPVGPSIGTFASPRVHNYRLYFFGQGLSIAGSWMQNIAIGWLVLQLTHSGVLLGAMTAARFVPIVLLAPWGGLISDRSDRRPAGYGGGDRHLRVGVPGVAASGEDVGLPRGGGRLRNGRRLPGRRFDRRPDPRDEGPAAGPGEAAGPVEAAGPAVLASRTVAGDLERAPTARP